MIMLLSDIRSRGRHCNHQISDLALDQMISSSSDDIEKVDNEDPEGNVNIAEFIQSMANLSRKTTNPGSSSDQNINLEEMCHFYHH